MAEINSIHVKGVKKVGCDKCRSMAVWEYAPADGNGFYCDTHVPRGCSCNTMGYEHSGFHPRSRPDLDDQGRDLPCVEYWFDEEGYNYDDVA